MVFNLHTTDSGRNGFFMTNFQLKGVSIYCLNSAFTGTSLDLFFNLLTYYIVKEVNEIGKFRGANVLRVLG